MVMPYCERKEAVYDDFEEFHGNLGYPLNQTLYATLGEAEYSKDYTQTDESCIYLNFAIILLKGSEEIDFMKERLNELIRDENLIIYKEELNEEYIHFEKDLNELKSYLYK